TFSSWTVTMSWVTVVPSGMSTTATTVGCVVGAVGWGLLPGPVPFKVTAIATNATTARNTPMSRTSRFERFKIGLPEPCDRWQHCSIARRRRDYTNGLGPLGRFGRKPRTTQGESQGRVVRNNGVRIRPVRRRTARPMIGRAVEMSNGFRLLHGLD